MVKALPLTDGRSLVLGDLGNNFREQEEGVGMHPMVHLQIIAGSHIEESKIAR